MLQSISRFMQTGERVPVTVEQPPMPGFPPMFPSREQFASYYAENPVSSVPNQLLPLFFYMSKFLTLTQTCREREPSGTRRNLVVLLRVRRTRSHRCTPAAILLVLLVVLVLLPIRRSTAVLLFLRQEIWRHFRCHVFVSMMILGLV